MDPNNFKLTDDEIATTYERIFRKYAESRPSVTFPRLIIVGGQSGAGKSRVARLAEKELIKTGLPAMADIDETRQEHPKIDDIFTDYPFQMSEITNGVGWTWTSHLLFDTRKAKNNLVYQATIRQTNRIHNLIKTFQADGFAIDLFAMAVNCKISCHGIFKRFEDGITNYDITGEVPRWVPISFHNAVYRVFPDNVEELANNARLEKVGVFRRSGEQLYLSEGKLSHSDVGQAIIEERTRIWSPDEKMRLAKDWGELLKRIEERPNDHLKPRWYLTQAQMLAREAEFFANARQATNGESPNLVLETVELRTFNHVFTRSEDAGLVSYDSAVSMPMIPSRTITVPVAKANKGHGLT